MKLLNQLISAIKSKDSAISLFLNLSNITNASLTDAQGVGTITATYVVAGYVDDGYVK